MEQEKKITVRLESQEIRFDVMNKSHLTGEVQQAEGKDYRSVSYMQASEDDEDGYQLLRSISDAFARVKLEFSEYLKEEESTSNNLINGVVENGGQLKLSLCLPSNFNMAVCESLGAMLHDYIVYRTLSEWYLLTNKGAAQDYAVKSEEALAGAWSAVYSRVRPERPESCENINGYSK